MAMGAGAFSSSEDILMALAFSVCWWTFWLRCFCETWGKTTSTLRQEEEDWLLLGECEGIGASGDIMTGDQRSERCWAVYRTGYVVKWEVTSSRRRVQYGSWYAGHPAAASWSISMSRLASPARKCGSGGRGV